MASSSSDLNDGALFLDESQFSSSYSSLSGVSDGEPSDVQMIPPDVIAVDLEKSLEFVQINPDMTYSDVKLALQEKNFEVEKMQLFDGDMPLNDEDSVAPSVGKRIYGTFPEQHFHLTIHDLSESHNIERIHNTMQISKIKKLLKSDCGVSLNLFSYRGLELKDDTALIDVGINKDNQVLISRISVSISDRECDSHEEIHAYDFWTLDNLIKAYCENQRREMHEGAQLTMNGQLLDEKDKTLYQYDIGNGAELQYSVPPFTIQIYDSEETAQNPSGVQLEIEDHWTIEKVMVAYSRETGKSFMDGDNMMLYDSVLDPNIRVWRLRIGHKQELNIEREVQAKALPYLCSDCGEVVMLKSQDAVQCRSCFSKILYKKRTTRACQYDCR